MAKMEMLCERCVDLFQGDWEKDAPIFIYDKKARQNKDHRRVEKLSNAQGCFLCHRAWQHISLELRDQSKLSFQVAIKRSLVE